MTREEIKNGIDNLRFTIDMFLFDPMTGRMKDYEELNGDDKATVDGCRAGIEALEKQIPKRPIVYKNRDYFVTCYVYECPNCKSEIREDAVIEEYEYCIDCGQAIDWSEAE